jgi:hypothetical protein
MTGEKNSLNIQMCDILSDDVKESPDRLRDGKERKKKNVTYRRDDNDE